MTKIGSDDDREQIDIAVIGAGVAGTYCCWRLQAAQNKRRVALFEMSDRIGGRLWSVDIPQIPGVVGELGGMRFLDLQRMVCQSRSTFEASCLRLSDGRSTKYLHTTRHAAEECSLRISAARTIKLLPGEQGVGPGELLVKAIETVIPNATN